MLKDIDERLYRWGDYMRERVDAGIGYPRANPIHRCITEGPGAGERSAWVPTAMPRDVERVECAVVAMPHELRMLVKLRYLRRETDRHAANALGVAVATYRQRVDWVHYWLAGHLADVA